MASNIRQALERGQSLLFKRRKVLDGLDDVRAISAGPTAFAAPAAAADAQRSVSSAAARWAAGERARVVIVVGVSGAGEGCCVVARGVKMS